MKNRMPFDYINSLDSQTRKTMGTRSQQETGFSLSVYARCHGFTRTIDMAKRSSTKTRYRLIRPVNEWKLQHVKIDNLVSLSFVVNLKSSIRFELDFKMADLQATQCGRCLLLIGQSATGDSIGSLCFLPCVLIIPSILPSFFYPKYTPNSRYC